MPNYHAAKCWSHLFATGTLLLLSHAIFAATYSLPAGPLPSGCSRSGSQVNCTNVTLNNSDIVVVSGNVTWNVVNLTLGNGVSINSGGSPSTLTMNVTSNLNAGTGIVLTANLQAPNISIGNNAVIRGNFVSTSNITLGNNLDMQGTLQGVNINVGNNGQIIGNITASSALNLGNNTKVHGYCSPHRPNCYPPIGALNHYRFEHPSGGLTCEPATITLKACQDASCNTLYTGNVRVGLTPSGSNSTWNGTNVQANQVDFSGGRVVLQLAQTSAATVTLGASGTPAAPNATVCLKDGTAGNCQMSFASGGSSFMLAPPIDNLGCKAANWTITAASCGSNKLNGQKNIRFWYEYVTPASPISPVAPTLNGTALPATDPGAGNGRSLSFINGVATIPSLRYADAGRLRILAAYQGTSATGDAGVSLSGNATSVFRPLALWVDDPASSCAAGNSSCTAYRKAGESFDLSIKAVCWDGADDTDNNGIADSGANLGNNALMPNFSITEAVLAPELLAPSGGANAVLTDATGTPGNDQFSASSGNVTVSGLRLSEVGVFRFTAQGSYLGTNIPAAPGTGKPVGRFYPHHFDTEVLPAHTTFTYSGQPFPIKIAAKNLANSTTVNYTGAFARTTTLSDANGNAGSYNPATLSAADFASGIADATTPARIAFTFTNKLTAPATICVRAGDGETSSASGSEGSTPLRSGRLFISNAHGSEHLQLSMPIQTQYWNGSVWLTNTLDSYTSLTGALVTNASPCSTPTPGPIANGRGSLTFPAPGSPCGVDICAQLGSDANHALTACQPAVAGRAIWLQGSWDSDGNYDDNPAARATFGIFSGRQPIIYRRERY